MSIPSHKSSSKKAPGVQAPQRSNGKLRVAAILEAATAVIAEKGYEGATMAEIAVRSGTKIGSLYRFFANKESLADTIVRDARQSLEGAFDRLEARVNSLSIQALADGLMALIFDLFTQRAVMKLLDAGPDWSATREEFRSAIVRRTAKSLVIHTPKLSKKSAVDIAIVILLNVKAVAANQSFFDSTSAGAPREFRDMVRLYLESRLGLFKSGKG